MKVNLQDFITQKTTLTLGGKEFVFTRLNLDDLAKLYEWVANEKESTRSKRRDRIIEDAKKIGDVDPMSLLKHLDDPPTEAEQDAALGTIEGLAQMAMWSLRHTYEDITNTQVKSIITLEDTEKIVTACMGIIPETEKKIATTRTGAQ